jgi:hypothetical protein
MDELNKGLLCVLRSSVCRFCAGDHEGKYLMNLGAQAKIDAGAGYIFIPEIAGRGKRL